MKITAMAGLALLAGALVAGQQLTGSSPAEFANQIRLDRPVGDGGSSPAPAPSAGGMIADVDAEQALRILQGSKFRAITLEQGKGGPYLKAVIDNQPTYVWLNNCQQNRCRALHFAAYLGKQDSVSDEFIHDYNRNTMFTKMAKDKDGELQVTMGISLARGVSEEHIRFMGESWVIYFKQALEYKPEGK